MTELAKPIVKASGRILDKDGNVIGTFKFEGPVDLPQEKPQGEKENADPVNNGA